MSGCGYVNPGRPPCEMCKVYDWIEATLLAEGCRLADFDAVEVIASRLRAQGVTLAQVQSGGVLSDVFWRAVYGPAYPALVTA